MIPTRTSRAALRGSNSTPTPQPTTNTPQQVSPLAKYKARDVFNEGDELTTEQVNQLLANQFNMQEFGLQPNGVNNFATGQAFVDANRNANRDEFSPQNTYTKAKSVGLGPNGQIIQYSFVPVDGSDGVMKMRPKATDPNAPFMGGGDSEPPMETYYEGRTDPTKWKVKERWTWDDPNSWHSAEAEEQADGFDLLSLAPLALAFVPGFQALAGTIGQGLGMSAGLGATALGTGVMSGGLNLLQTGDLKSALKTGVLSGAGTYAGGALSDYGKAAGWGADLTKGVSGATRGLISSGGNPYGAITGGLTPFLPQSVQPFTGTLVNAARGKPFNPYQLAQGFVNSINRPTKP